MKQSNIFSTLTRSLSLSKCNPLLKPLPIVFAIVLMAMSATPTFATVSISPTSRTVTQGGSASYTVTASGLFVVGATPVDAITWYSNAEGTQNPTTTLPAGITVPSYTYAACTGICIPGSMIATVIVNVGNTAAVKTYYFRVTRNGQQSEVASLIVTAAAPPPEITSHPKDVSVNEGGTAHFSVNATGSGTLGYLWYISVNGGSAWYALDDGAYPAAGTVSGSHTKNLELANLTLAASGWQFQCVIFGATSTAESNPAKLTVIPPPIFTMQPTDQTVVEGGTAEFSVGVTGSGTLQYQWLLTNGYDELPLFDHTDPETGMKISGSSTSKLRLENVSLDFNEWNNMGLKIVCAVSNTGNLGEGNSVLSNSASLTVTPATYVVTVVNGTVAGGSSFEAGATVVITANEPAAGREFDSWVCADVTFAGASDMTTTFVMPARAVTVTATYRDAVANEQLDAGQLKAWTQNGMLYVSGLTTGAEWRVYNLIGTLIYAGAGSDRLDATLPLPARGVYIVTDGKTVIKVIN